MHHVHLLYLPPLSWCYCWAFLSSDLPQPTASTEASDSQSTRRRLALSSSSSACDSVPRDQCSLRFSSVVPIELRIQHHHGRRCSSNCDINYDMSMHFRRVVVQAVDVDIIIGAGLQFTHFLVQRSSSARNTTVQDSHRNKHRDKWPMTSRVSSFD